MKKQTVSFMTKHYFQGIFMYLGVMLGMISLILIIFQPIVAGGFAFITFLAITTVYRVKIDLNNNTCFEYLWLLGIKKGETYSFNEITQVKMYQNKMTQKLRSRGSSSTIRYTLYTGYLILDGDKKVFVGESKHRDKLLNKLHEIATDLRAEVDEE